MALSGAVPDFAADMATAAATAAPSLSHCENADVAAACATSPSVETFLSPNGAVSYYRQCCADANVNPNRQIVKLLLMGRPAFDFHDGYLGVHGIVPVMETLSRCGIREMDLRDCALGTEEARVICEHFENHSRLQKVDLRGNNFTDAAAKLLLRLAIRNPHIRELLVDDSVPRYLRIQQQCITNSGGGAVQRGADEVVATKAAGACLVCGVISVQESGSRSTTGHVNLLLSTILDHFARCGDATSAAGNEALFRLLMSCCDAGDGVLFLCSDGCAESLGHEILQSVRYVHTTCHAQMPCALPNLLHLRDASLQLVKEFTEVRRLQAEAFQEKSAAVNAHRDLSILRFVDEAAPGYQEPRTRCAVCGGRTDGIPSVPSELMYQFRHDFMNRALTVEGTVGENAVASVFPILARLSRVFVQFSFAPACSLACVRDLVRFGLYGYRGVLRAYPNEVPLLSSVLGGAAPAQESTPPSSAAAASTGAMRLLPQVSFSVVDFAAVTVDDVGQEDTVCAVTVASAMEDIDGVPIDPYFLFAMGRRLARQPPTSIGSELQCVCEAARVCGCLAQSAAPFQRRRGDRPSGASWAASPPARDDHTNGGVPHPTADFLVGNWDSWGAAFGADAIKAMLHSAFARRRQGLYMVDGPHGNMFDNIRAALWSYRHQRRAVLVALEFSADWLTRADGRLTDMTCAGTSSHDSAADNGKCARFFTTVKVVGQSIMDNSSYLILQANFGPDAGSRGFFYMDRATFLQSVSGNAYIFLDVPARCPTHADAIGKGEAWTLSTYASQVAAPAAVRIANHLSHTRVAFSEVACDGREDVMPSELRRTLLDAIANELAKKEAAPHGHVDGDGSGEGHASEAPLSSWNFDGRAVPTRCAANWLRYLHSVLNVQGVAAVSELLFMMSEVCPPGATERFSQIVSGLRRAFPSIGEVIIATALQQSSGSKRDEHRPEDAAAPHEWLLISPTAGKREPLPISMSLTTATEEAQQPSKQADAATPSGPASRQANNEKPPRGPEKPSAPTLPATAKVSRGTGVAQKQRGREKKRIGGRGSSSPAPPGAARRASSRSPAASKNSSRSSTASPRPGSAPRPSSAERTPSPTTSGRSSSIRSASGEGRRGKKSASATERKDGRRRTSSRGGGGGGDSLRADPKGERGQRASLLTEERATNALTAAPGLPSSSSLCEPTEATSPSSPSAVGESIPPHLIGQPWSLIHLVDGNGVTTRHVAAFIGDHVCVYSASPAAQESGRGGRAVIPLTPIRECPLFMELPFSSGFDCAFNHPLHPRKVFFLSGSLGVVWDAWLQECVTAPFPLATSPTFMRIPSVFRSDGTKKLECVVPIPGTPLVLLFGQLMYAVYDLEKGSAVSEAMVLETPIDASAGDRGKNSGLIAMAEAASASALAAGEMQAQENGEDAVLAIRSFVPRTLWNKSRPFFTAHATSHLARSPLTSVWMRQLENCVNDRSDPPREEDPQRRVSEFTLVMADGHAVTMSIPTQRGDWDSFAVSQASVRPLAATALGALPPLFQQSRLSSLAALCTAAVHSVGGAEVPGELQRFVPSPSSMPGVSVSSSLPRGPQAIRAPLELLLLPPTKAARPAAHRCSSPTPDGVDMRDDTFAHHVHFCGEQLPETHGRGKARRSSAALGPASPVMAHTITMDLGEGHYETFCAVVLVLDTSRVHPFVLTHASVKVGVELSDDGVIYRQHAVFFLGKQGTGSITAGVWREQPHVARFWQLRLHADVPAEVGVVRTIWYRRMGACGGSSGAAFAPVPPLSLGAPRSTTAHPAAVACSGVPGNALETVLPYFIPRDASKTVVRVEAPRLFCDPAQLLNPIPLNAVFTSATTTPRSPPGWFPPHGIVPLLAGGTDTAVHPAVVKASCLIACGTDFVEYDFAKRHVVGQRSFNFSEHPAFRDLPFPFSKGIQGAFYLSPASQPNTVVLLADDQLLRWNLLEGRAEGDSRPVRFSDDAAMEGMPVHAPHSHEVVSVFNDWTRPGELLVFFSSRGGGGTGGRAIGSIEVLRWNCHTRELVSRPAPLCTHPLFQEGLAECAQDAQLHCAFMDAASRYLLLVEGKLVSVDALLPPSHGKRPLTVSEVSHDKQLYPVTVHLPEFTQARHASSLVLDLRDTPVLALGVELTSSHGSFKGAAEPWTIAYSDNGLIWVDVGKHTHCGLTSRATWRPDQVASVAHRFWRLTCTYGGANGAADGSESVDSCEAPTPQLNPHFLYSQVRLLTIPERPCLSVPHRVALSAGGVVEGADEMFRWHADDGSGGAPESLPVLLRFTEGGLVASLTLDYGREAPELSGFSCLRTRAGEAEDSRRSLEALSGILAQEKWRVECSDDGKSWAECGAWRADILTRRVHMRWAPLRACRFWRISLHPIEVDTSSMTWSHVSIYAYDGHSVFVRSGRTSPVEDRSGASAAPVANVTSGVIFSSSVSLAASGAAVRQQKPTSLLPAALGSCLTIDTKATTPAALTGILIHCDGKHPANHKIVSCASRVELLAEFSPNGTHWYAITSVLYFTGQEQPIFARWDMVGTYRYWRLRVVNVDGSDDGAIAIDRVQLFRAASQLYRTFLSQQSVREPALFASRSEEASYTASAAARSSDDHKSTAFLANRGTANHHSSSFMALTESRAYGPVVEETEMVYLRLPSQQAIVRVDACVPPSAAYAVERLDLDGISWSHVAMMRNDSEDSRHVEVMCAWPRGLVSSTWRLRCVTPGLQGRLHLPVTWYAFANERAVLVDLNNTRNVLFTHRGFTELMSAELLFRGKTAFDANRAVLRASCTREQSTATRAAAATKRPKTSPGTTGGPPASCGKEPSKEPSKEPDPYLQWSFESPVTLQQLALKGSLSHRADSETSNAANQGIVGGEAAGTGEDGVSEHSVPLDRSGKADANHLATAFDANNPSCLTEDQRGVSEAAMILVETSFNGTDFAAVASCALLDMTSGKALSWERSEHTLSATTAPHWRVRFEGVTADQVLDLVCASWYVVCGLPGIVPAADTLITSNTSHAAWQQDVFNREDAFCRTCQMGFDQAKSLSSKLREGGDVDRCGAIADAVWNMKSRFRAFIGKTSKSVAQRAKGGDGDAQLLQRVPARLLPLLASGTDLATDLLFFMLKTAERYPESEVLRLVEMVGCAVNLTKSPVFSKRDSPYWFYPHFAMHGTLKEDFHGIDGSAVTACFAMYWSLSLALQRDSDVLVGSDGATLDAGGGGKGRGQEKERAAAPLPGLSDLSPHVASPLLVFFWEHRKNLSWLPSECFPSLPILWYAGFGHPVHGPASAGPTSAPSSPQPSKSPATVMVCAINEMTFSDKYPLCIGESATPKALPLPTFPFRVCAGVNFIQFAPVPAFLLDTLRILYRLKFLETHRTTLVLTTSSLHAQSGQLRFTLPATEGGTQPGSDGVNFGMKGVSISSLEFEVNITATATNGLAGAVFAHDDGSNPDGKLDLPDASGAFASRSTGSFSLFPVERVSLRKRQYAFDFHVSVISHGASYTLPTAVAADERGDDDPKTAAPRSFPVSILANLDASEALVPLRCRCANANMPLSTLPLVVMSTFDVSVAVERRHHGVLLCPPICITGSVNLASFESTQACAYTVLPGQPWNAPKKVHLTLVDVSLREFVLAGRILLGLRSPDSTYFHKMQRVAEHEWLQELPVVFSCMRMSFNIPKRRVYGVGGTLRLYNATSQDTTVCVCDSDFMISGTVDSVTVGNLAVEPMHMGHGEHRVNFSIGNVPPTQDAALKSDVAVAAGGGASAAVVEPDTRPIWIQIHGCSRLTSGTDAMAISVEISQEHMLALAGNSAVNVSLGATNDVMGNKKRTVAYHAVQPVCVTAQVQLNAGLFFRKIAAMLGRSPIVRRLRAQGLPFTFTPQELSIVEPMRVAQHRVSAVLRGVFFGSWFEVFATTADLGDASSESVNNFSTRLALEVLEYSQEALWKSYVNVVGLREQTGAHEEPDSFLAVWERKQKASSDG